LAHAALALAAPHPAVATMARETRVRRGPVPRELDGTRLGNGNWALAGDCFLLRAEPSIGVLYRRGEGLTVEHPDDADPRDVRLWLEGTAYAAVAALNGLLPLHASAVAHDGAVYAFAGPPGAGKSTLAAALGREGLPLFCDDTLLLDISGEGPIACLPGHKRLKLWPEGLTLARAHAREQVASDYPKLFAESAAGSVAEVLPLAALTFLETGEDPTLRPVGPGERIARLQDDHYTAALFERAEALPRPQRFARLSGIAARITMHRFARSLDPARFAENRAWMARQIRGGLA
jgi:hypothetical protein